MATTALLLLSASIRFPTEFHHLSSSCPTTPILLIMPYKRPFPYYRLGPIESTGFHNAKANKRSTYVCSSFELYLNHQETASAKRQKCLTTNEAVSYSIKAEPTGFDYECRSHAEYAMRAMAKLFDRGLSMEAFLSLE